MRIDKNTTIKLGDRNIIKIKIGDSVIWEKKTEPGIDYFYVENVDMSDGEITFTTKKINSPTVGKYAEKIEYSNDKTNWNTINFNTSTPQTVNIKSGEKVYLRNDSGLFNFVSTSSYKTTINTTKKCKVGGNINTLLNYNEEIFDISGKNGCFSELFYNATNIIDVSKLVLPATTLADYCYFWLFYGCTSLVNAPALPATTLASYCYSSMFYGCTSLTTAPALPATTLASYCYSSMFYGCTSLTTAPTELPATTFESSCYEEMFRNCTSLTSAPELPATTLSYSCYKSMFMSCTSLTTAPALPATTLASYCYSSMFYGCTGLTSTPTLPATTLVSSCYKSMFYGCTSLTTAPTELPATTFESNCCQAMFQNCTSLTTAPTFPNATTMGNTCCRDMFNNCTSLTTAPTLPATTLANDCYNSMFVDCKKLTTAPALPATTLASDCYSAMFMRCSSLVNAPELPATTLASNCYNWMFNGCSKLKSVTIYATKSATNAFKNWLDSVSSSGTIYNNGFIQLPTKSSSGIPFGWTEITPEIESITANPDTFTIKSYTTSVTCKSTLTITTTTGITNTRTNSATITVGENTGDTTRTLTETIPYKGSSYQVTIVQTANDVKPPMSWNVVSEGTYPFQLNSNGYYESTNKGKSSSYSYATLNYEGYDTLVLECINSGESNYDYGIISQPDVQLSESTSDDGASGSTKVFKNFKGQSSTNPVQITIPSDEGSHFITIKFRKDGGGDSNNDSLQFRVIEP